MAGSQHGNRGVRIARPRGPTSNALVRFNPGAYVPAPSIPSWSRVITVGVSRDDLAKGSVLLDLATLITAPLRGVGFKAILVKRMAVYAIPQNDVAPIVTMVPGIVGSNPEFRVAATSVAVSASVGVNIPPDFQGPYVLSDNRNVVALTANCGVWFRLHVVLLP